MFKRLRSRGSGDLICCLNAASPGVEQLIDGYPRHLFVGPGLPPNKLFPGSVRPSAFERCFSLLRLFVAGTAGVNW
jgi:hypothetical protein